MKVVLVIRQDIASAGKAVDSVWAEKDSGLALERVNMIELEKTSYKAWIEIHELRN